MRFEALMDGAPGSPLYQYIADTYASLLPKATEYGVPTAEQLCPLDEMPQHLAANVQGLGYAVFVAPLVSAWCKV